jgi:hypothetical protein
MNMFEMNSKIAVIMILPRMANEVCQAFPSHACCARNWNVNASSQLSRHVSIRPESELKLESVRFARSDSDSSSPPRTQPES